MNKPKAASPSTAPAKTKSLADPVLLIDRLFDLASDAGGMGALKRLVDRLAPPGKA